MSRKEVRMMSPLHKKYLLVLFIMESTQIALCSEPSVNINGAAIIGKYGVADFQGTKKIFKSFKGIPYAEPPLGKLRFRKPQPLRQFMTKTLGAFEYGTACLQPSQPMPLKMLKPKTQSEDCLYLNVFVPDQKPDLPSGHAVMVYIHGGGYVVGAGELNGEYPAAYGNVIVVTINYRLGAFGFLGLGDKEFPGNLGLWDQQLALQWVHDNIAAFGGDNNRVTIFGESAGSASVIHQALYPKNEGLFQRVIAESGTPALKAIFLYTHQESLKMYSELVGCNLATPKQQISCLQDKSADEIAAVVEIVNNERSLFGTKLFAYLDNDFITIDPFDPEAFDKGQSSDAVTFYRSLDVIHGVNSHEGLFLFDSIFSPFIDNPTTFKPTKQQMDEEAIPTIVGMHYGALSDPLWKMVNDFYTDWSDPHNPELIRDQLVKLMGDLLMVIPMVKYSRLHVNTSEDTNSYVYRFSPTPSNPIFPKLDWSCGANHVEDLNFVFFFHAFDERFPRTDWEYELAYDMMTYWTNFAKTGNPNKPNPVKVQWQNYDMKDQRFLEFDRDMTEEYSQKYFSAREADFWLNTIPMLQKALDETLNRTNNDGTCSADGDCP